MSERVPDAKDYPHIPPELLTAGSVVFVKLSQAVKAAKFSYWWHFTEVANWRNPLGSGINIDGRDHFPVIHVAYEDAVEYANWKGHRLPTEAEYEFASRGGLDGAKYATGSSLTENGVYIANTWQGLFPFNDTAEDGYVGHRAGRMLSTQLLWHSRLNRQRMGVDTKCLLPSPLCA